MGCWCSTSVSHNPSQKNGPGVFVPQRRPLNEEVVRQPVEKPSCQRQRVHPTHTLHINHQHLLHSKESEQERCHTHGNAGSWAVTQHLQQHRGQSLSTCTRGARGARGAGEHTQQQGGAAAQPAGASWSSLDPGDLEDLLLVLLEGTWCLSEVKDVCRYVSTVGVPGTELYRHCWTIVRLVCFVNSSCLKDLTNERLSSAGFGYQDCCCVSSTLTTTISICVFTALTSTGPGFRATLMSTAVFTR